jgi:hypothetical protein
MRLDCRSVSENHLGFKPHGAAKGRLLPFLLNPHLNVGSFHRLSGLQFRRDLRQSDTRNRGRTGLTAIEG